MSARDHAMARLAVVHLLTAAMDEQLDGLLAEFVQPEKKDVSERLQTLDDMLADCHAMAIALGQARDATESMTAEEIVLCEEDLAPPEEGDELGDEAAGAGG